MSDQVERAASAAKQGKVIAYPTDTLWGLGARMADERAVRRVFEIKGRPRSEPLSIALASVQDIAEYATVTPTARRLLPLLPGALTLVLPRRASVPDLVTGGRDHVGIRVPAHPACRRLVEKTGPLTSTSANLHGQAEPRTLEEIRGVFGDQVGFYLSDPLLPAGVASTVVDARSASVKILRAGAIRESRILELAAD